MYNGYSKYGKGPASGASGYMLDAQYYDTETESWEDRDPPPVVMRGDPVRFERHVDAIAREWKYSSGVMSFTAADTQRLSPEDVERIIDLWEEFTFAGIPEQDRDPLVVQQTHLGRLELHYAMARENPATSKAWNPAPPGPARYAENDAFQRYINVVFDLDDPQDPARARKFIIKPGDPAADIKEKIYERIDVGLERGTIRNRGDIVALLEKGGFKIRRRGEDYLSVKTDSMKKAVRLKGKIFHKDFSAEKFHERLSVYGRERARPREDRVRDAEIEFRAAIAQRSARVTSPKSTKITRTAVGGGAKNMGGVSEITARLNRTLRSDRSGDTNRVATKFQSGAITQGYGRVHRQAGQSVGLSVIDPIDNQIISGDPTKLSSDDSYSYARTLEQLAAKNEAAMAKARRKAEEHAANMQRIFRSGIDAIKKIITTMNGEVHDSSNGARARIIRDVEAAGRGTEHVFRRSAETVIECQQLIGGATISAGKNYHRLAVTACDVERRAGVLRHYCDAVEGDLRTIERIISNPVVLRKIQAAIRVSRRRPQSATSDDYHC